MTTPFTTQDAQRALEVCERATVGEFVYVHDEQSTHDHVALKTTKALLTIATMSGQNREANACMFAIARTALPLACTRVLELEREVESWRGSDFERQLDEARVEAVEYREQRDCAAKERDSAREQLANASQLALDQAREVARLGKALERATAIADEALSYAHGIPTIVDTLRDELTAIRDAGGCK